jgi:SET domain-containing protein
MGLIIRSSAIHAAGCYTTQPIRKGTRVVEYDGPRIPKDVADVRYENRVVTYLFGIDGTGDVIDGFGIAMFINHSCDPNCETENIDGRIFVTAIRNIAANEELTYEYNLYDSDEEDCPCFCGAPICRGTMFSDEEVERRARLAKRRSAADLRKRAARNGHSA